MSSSSMFDDGITDEELVQAMDDYEFAQAMEAHEDDGQRVNDDEDTLPGSPYQEGGGGVTDDTAAHGRFVFHLDPVHTRRSRAFGVTERVHHVRVTQEGEFAQHQRLTDALTLALRSALDVLLNSDTINDRDRIYIHMSSQRLPNAYSYRGATAGEWRNHVARTQGILEHVAVLLNSNEGFEVDDSFQLDVVHVIRQPPGSRHEKRYVPGNRPIKRLREMKRTVIEIKGEDGGICCARALVTSKAKADRYPMAVVSTRVHAPTQ